MQKEEIETIVEQPEVLIEETPTEPKMSAYRQRLKSRYPEDNPASDEEWDDLTERAMSEDADTIESFTSDRKVIDDILASDKDLAMVVADMIANKQPFRAALAKVVDPADLEAKEGDEDYEYYQKSYEERVAIGNEIRQRAEERLANEQEAYDNIDAYCEGKGYDDEQKKAFISFINDFYNNLQMRKISKEMLQQLDNARNYDADVEAAEEEGKIAGRNENIEAKMADASAKKGDGMPAPMGSGAPVNEAPKKAVDPIFGNLKRRDRV